jgi:hypothetical protein
MDLNLIELKDGELLKSRRIMSPTSRIIAVSLGILFIGTVANTFLLPAQQDPSTKPTNKNARDTSPTDQSQLVTRVIEVLASTAEDAKKWDDSGLAAKAQSQIADLIWDENSEKALEYLKEAWVAAAKVKEPNRVRSTFMNPSLRNSIRREVLLIARKRSPELANRWLEEIAQESHSEENGGGTFDDRTARSSVLLQMAIEVVADNPQAAADLAIESLRDGISFNLQTVLVQIQQRDMRLAESVFQAALKRLAVGFSDPNELLTLYAYLYTPGRVYGTNSSDDRNRFPMVVGGAQVSVPAGRQNPALALEFLDLASDLLLNAPLPNATNNPLMSARSQLSVIGWLMGELTQRLPIKAALLRARAQQMDYDAQFSNLPSAPRPGIPEMLPGEAKEDYAERRVDILEEAAAKIKDVLARNIAYAKAAVATTVEHFERGLNLAGKIEDKELREAMRSWLIYRATLHFVASGNLEEAYKLNSKNEDAVQRATCLIVGAQRLLKDKDMIRAGEWLREARALVRKNETSESWSRIALGITSTYGGFDMQASVDSLREAVKLMKKNPLTSLTEDRAPAFKRLSGITPPSDLNSRTAGFSLQAAIAVFPAEEFEQTLYTLEDLTPPEARGLALITLCRNYLNTKVKGSKKPLS